MPPFRYEAPPVAQPYRSPYTAAIADAIGNQGQARARMWQNLAQQGTNTLADWVQYQREAPKRQLQALQVQDQQQQMADDRALRQAYQQSGGDPNQMRQILSSRGGMTLKNDVLLNQLTEHKQSQDAEATSKIGRWVHTQGNTPEALQGAFDAAEKAGLMTAEDVQRMAAVANSDPSKIPQLASEMIGATKSGQEWLKSQTPKTEPIKTREVKTLNPDGTETIQIVKDEPGQTFTSAVKPATVPAPVAGTFGDYLTRVAAGKGVPIGKLSPSDVRAAKTEFDAAGRAPKEAPDITDVTPAAVDLAALNYRKTGLMPPLGMGDKHTRQNILNRAATLTPDDITRIEAGGGDIAVNKAEYKVNTGSLAAIQKQRDAIGAFEETAKKNIDIFLNTAGKIVDTGSPLANSLVRSASGKLLGSPDQAAYDAARQVAVNEIAKITSNPNLTGSLSDSARHEVEAFNPREATLAQTVAVMRLLKQDMANRTKALDDQITTIRGRMGGVNAVTPTGPKVGERRTINGRLGEWDGKGWAAVQP